MNEAETRAEHVDPALATAGWGVVGHSRIRREYPRDHAHCYSMQCAFSFAVK